MRSLLLVLLAFPLLGQDLLIKGGSIYDGTGRAPFPADIRIEAGRITAIGSLTARKGETVVEARGMAVAPGAIDIHNHSERGLENEPAASSQVAQGITTLAVGPDGGGPWPVRDYLAKREKMGIAVNVAAFAGHATIRRNILGSDYNRAATPAEIEAMAKQVDEAMRDGAFGLSTGLEYDIGFRSTTEEIIELAKVASRHGGIYMTHMRDESDHMLDALAETLRIGREASLPVQISHIKLGTIGVWGKAGDVIAAVDKARAAGQDVTADMYPYDAWSSTITVLVPSRKHTDAAAVRQGIDDVGGASRITVTSCKAHPDLEGKTLAQAAESLKTTDAEAYMKIVRDGGASIVCHSMSPPDMSKFVRAPWVMTASDGGIGMRHPRGAGTFVRLLSGAFEPAAGMPLQETIRRMTSAPAHRLGLADRGELRIGARADLMLFQPGQLHEEATFEKPSRLATGMSLVLVNGVPVWKDGKVTGSLPGQVLRHSQQRVFERLKSLAARDSRLATEQAAMLRNERWRETVLQEAFVTASARDREFAALVLPDYAGRPWLGKVAFLDALALNHPELVLASARANPALAIRQNEAYLSRPYGRETLDAAAAAAPDEAVLAASGTSPSSLRLRAALASSARPDIRVLAEIAASSQLDPAVRARIAALHKGIAQGALTLPALATAAQNNARYFALLVDARLQAQPADVPPLDRILESQALRLCRLYQESPGLSELAQFAPRDLFLLLAYGRAEEDDKFFATIFDRLLVPKLHSLGIAAILKQTQGLKFRQFAGEALAFGRFSAFFRMARTDQERQALLERVAMGLETSARPLEEAAAAAEILAANDLLRPLLRKELDRVVAAGDPAGEAIYRALLSEAAASNSALEADRLFDGGAGIERQFFYNDPDGVESYGVFRSTYAADPKWAVEEHPAGWVRLYSKGAARRIEVFSNVPIDLTLAANSGRDAEAGSRLDAVTRELNRRRLEPSIVIHRGHSYHVDKTIPYIRTSTRLVFLGSCRGLGKLDAVVENAPEAEVIATSGVGSHRVNDPFLKNLNDELLRGNSVLDWPSFWEAQRTKLGGTGLFAAYIPPFRNSTLAFLRGYFAYLDKL